MINRPPGPNEPARGASAGSDASAVVRSAVRAVRGGNPDAFGAIVEHYQRKLFGLALMTVRDPAAAEELVQDAFVRAYTHLDAYDASRPFFPWLATIAVRLSQNWLRRRARFGPSASMPDAMAVDAVPDDRIDPLESLVADERARWLWRQVAALSSGQRTAVLLHYRDGLTTGEIGQALGVTSGTVKTLLFRARRRLREALADAGLETGETEEPNTEDAT